MNRIRITFLTGVMMIALVSHMFSQDHDFRDTDWGMTKEEVRQVEKAVACTNPALDLKQDCLCYIETLGDLPYELYYCFRDNKLESAFYQRNETTYSSGTLVDLFYTLKLILEKKYGSEYFTVMKEGAGWGEYTMLVESKKDMENLIRQDEFMIRLVWKKDDRTHVTLELENMKTSNVRNGTINIRYEPASKSLLYNDKSFDKEDYEKL